MSTKAYRPPDYDRVSTNTDALDDLPQRHAREELIPRIAKKSRNAVNVTPIYVEYFQRLKVGRRCSCWGVEDSPSGLCPVCLGVGIVGAYNKRGTKTEIFDVTYPNVATVNIKPDYGVPTRPIYWTLVNTATYGVMTFNIPIMNNVGILDVLDIKDFQPNGTTINYEIKAPTESSYVALTESSITSRLSNNNINVKITMTRATPSTKLPKLVGIRLSYRLLRITSLRVDIPRVTESLTLEEFGIYESWTSQNFFLDNTLANATTEDFLINLLDNTRWKVIEVRDNKPMGILTSWDLTCRKIQSYEPYTQIPAGELDTTALPPEFVRSIQTDADILAQDNETTSRGDRKPGHRAKDVKVSQAITVPGATDPSEPLREV